MVASRLRFELLFAAGWLAFGALILPALVYGVGTVLLGTYADGSLGALYGNFYRDLFSGSTAALALLFGPYVILMLARIPLIGRRKPAHDSPVKDHEASAPPTKRAASAKPRPERIEPRIGNGN
jgi:hypothetical protein